uniref:Uncharacterized protein n=1 Tax=Anguilla anguilla TaxID=7936 RepID=A0A0E9V918_ANGAN
MIFGSKNFIRNLDYWFFPGMLLVIFPWLSFRAVLPAQ